jgi:hypothetical protein
MCGSLQHVSSFNHATDESLDIMLLTKMNCVKLFLFAQTERISTCAILPLMKIHSVLLEERNKISNSLSVGQGPNTDVYCNNRAFENGSARSSQAIGSTPLELTQP